MESFLDRLVADSYYVCMCVFVSDTYDVYFSPCVCVYKMDQVVPAVSSAWCSWTWRGPAVHRVGCWSVWTETLRGPLTPQYKLSAPFNLGRTVYTVLYGAACYTNTKLFMAVNYGCVWGGWREMIVTITTETECVQIDQVMPAAPWCSWIWRGPAMHRVWCWKSVWTHLHHSINCRSRLTWGRQFILYCTGQPATPTQGWKKPGFKKKKKKTQPTGFYCFFLFILHINA